MPRSLMVQSSFYGCESNAPVERRPTGKEPRIGTEPALWAVRSTGLFGDTLPLSGSAAGRAKATPPCSQQFLTLEPQSEPFGNLGLPLRACRLAGTREHVMPVE